MKWTKKPLPKHGDSRIRWAFMFLPKRIGDEVRWLEFAKWHEGYVVEQDGARRRSGWVAMEWHRKTGH